MNNFYSSMSTVMVFLDSYDIESPEYEGMVEMILKLKYTRLFAIESFDITVELKHSRKKGGFNIIVVSADIKKIKRFKETIDGSKVVKWFIVGDNVENISILNLAKKFPFPEMVFGNTNDSLKQLIDINLNKRCDELVIFMHVLSPSTYALSEEKRSFVKVLDSPVIKHYLKRGSLNIISVTHIYKGNDDGEEEIKDE